MSEIIPIQQAIKVVTETLRNISQNIILPDHIGVKRPIYESSLPTVVISAKDLREFGPGIGNLIGAQKADEDRVSEIKSSKISGIFQMNIWDQSDAKIDEITTAILEIINTKKIDLEKDGFMYLSLKSFGEIYPAKLSTNPQKEALVRLIEYQGTFELISRETFGPERAIKEIHVHIDDILNENMILKKKDDNS